MRTIYFLSLFLLLSGIANAQTVSQSEAMMKAQGVFSSIPRAKGGSATDVSVKLAYTSASGDKTRYYVFNNTGGGFVIVGGDKAACEILGYSDSDNFDYEKIPDNFRWWLSQYDVQIDNAIDISRNGDVQAAKRKKAPRAAVSIEPLLGTGDDAIQWDQGRPYNLAIDGGKGSFLVGCVSIAGAQIMKYYEYPAQDTDIRYDALLLDTVDGEDAYAPAITEDYTYDWSSMKHQYSYYKPFSLSDPDVKDLANLCYRLSRSVGAKYGTSGTGASLHALGKTMIENFKYDKSLQFKQRENYTDEQWENMIYKELSSKRPVAYAGSSIGYGHAFVCDGYNAGNDTYHINWGWDGLYDGYFVINGSEALSSGACAPFNYGHEILMNIMPDRGNDYPYYLSASGFTIEKKEVIAEGSITLGGKFVNDTYETFSGRYGVMYVNVEDENDNEIVAKSSINMPPRFGVVSVTVDIPGSLKEGNRYYLIPVYEDRNGEWQRCVLYCDSEIPIITIVPPDPAAFSTTGYILKENNVFLGGNTDIIGEFKNHSNGKFKGYYGVMFVNTEDESDYDVAFASNYQGVAPYSSFTNITVNVPKTLKEAGHYYVIPVFEDENGDIQRFQMPKEFEIPVIDIRVFDRSIKGGCNQWKLSADKIALGYYFEAEGNYGNEGECETVMAFGFKFTNVNDSKDTVCVASNKIDLRPKYYLDWKFYAVASTRLTVGETYRVTSMYLDNNNEWQECIKKSNFEDPTVLITPPTGLIMTEEPVIKNKGFVTKEDCNLTFKIKNMSDETISRSITVGYDYIGIGSPSATFTPNEEKAFKYAIDLKNSSNGRHLIKIDNNGRDMYRAVVTLVDELSITCIMPYDKWTTICLPYEADVPDGLTAYSVTGVSGEAVEKVQVTKLEMNKPYLINGSEGIYTFTGPDTPTGTSQNGLLHGITTVPEEGSEFYAPAGSYVLQEQGTAIGFLRVDEDSIQDINPYSAYLKVPEKMLSTKFFYLDDIDTAIETVTEKRSEGKAYNVQGMRVKSNAKGLVIVDGKLRLNR